jgi:hypothetical protein
LTALRIRAALAVAALLWAGCITQPHVSDSERKGERGFTVIPLKAPALYLSSEAFRGHKRDPELTRLLANQLHRTLQERGYRIVADREEADYSLSTDLRGWWARSSRFAIVTTATLTLYTPLDYKWILDVDMTDRRGRPVAGLHERGGFRFETFGIVLFPATVYAYYQLVMPQWWKVAQDGAATTADFVVDQLGRPDPPTAGGRAPGGAP